MAKNKRIVITPGLIRQKAGIPKIYDRRDIVNAVYDYSKYAKTPTDEEINAAIEYLNKNGHNEINFNQIVGSLASIKENEPRGYDYLSINREHFGEFMKNLGKFAINTIDVPRKAIASLVQTNPMVKNHIPDAPDDRYAPGRVLDVMDSRPTPIIGVQKAIEHPILSSIVDVVTPLPIFALGNIASNTAENALSYAGRKQLQGLDKTLALEKIKTGTTPSNIGYQIENKIIPTKIKSGNSFVYGKYSHPTAVKRNLNVSGTNGPRGGWRLSRPSINSSKVGGNYTVLDGSKLQTNVFAWPIHPVSSLTWAGIPQFITPFQPVNNVEKPIEKDRIEAEYPMRFTDSDLIRWSGAEPGDTVVMPDGREIKYIIGNGGLGRTHERTIKQVYDAHDTDVKQQHNIPFRTEIRQGKGKHNVVRIPGGRHPESEYRDKTNYFPYIVR